jgi:putative oxidoreductase
MCCSSTPAGPIKTPGLVDLAGSDATRQQGMLDYMASTVPLGRVGDPDEVAGATLFLASSDASFIAGYRTLRRRRTGTDLTGQKLGVLTVSSTSRRLSMLATRYLPFVGRLMLGLPFAMSGLSKLGAYGATTGMISAVGLPFPSLAFAVAVAVELGGGLLLIAGYRVRYAAAALALFALVTAISFHANFADQNQMIHFLKNVMMAGGLLQIAAFGAGALSVDNRRKAGKPGSSPALPV